MGFGIYGIPLAFILRLIGHREYTTVAQVSSQQGKAKDKPKLACGGIAAESSVRVRVVVFYQYHAGTS